MHTVAWKGRLGPPDCIKGGKVHPQVADKHVYCAGLLDSWPTPAAKAKHQAALDRLQRLQLLLPARSKECAPHCCHRPAFLPVGQKK